MAPSLSDPAFHPVNSARRRTYATAFAIIAVIGAAWVAGWYGYVKQGWDNADRVSAQATPMKPSPDSKSVSVNEPREEFIDERPVSSARAPTALQWPLWEFQLSQPIPPRDPPLTPAGWRLIGATSVGGKRNLIIMRSGKSSPDFVRTGDVLPGGFVVGEITDEDVTLIHGDQSVLLSYIGIR